MHNRYAVADTDRAIIVAETALDVLGNDPRTEAAFYSWLVPLYVPATRLDAEDVEGPLSDALTLWLQRPAAQLLVPSRTDLEERCAHLVNTEFGLPYAWLTEWLAMLLSRWYVTRAPVAFQIREWTRSLDVRPGESLTVSLRRLDRARRPPGKPRPKTGGSSLERGVIWWYRHRFNGESKAALARELLQQEQTARGSDGRSTVRPAITAAEKELTQIGAGGSSYISLFFVSSGEITDGHFAMAK